ncbi:MAG: low molecular weight protein-tyrosine-phosphatase [Phycisphaerales bacterium]
MAKRTDDSDRMGVLFVCLGNICRSPMAEAIFLHHVRERELLDRFDIDSCGTGQWHVGERPDPRAVQVAKKNGVDMTSIARQLDPSSDFDRFDLFIPMDRENQGHLIGAGAPQSKVRLMRSFDPAHASKPNDAPDVPDPYFGEGDGFKNVFEMLSLACTGMLDELS